MRKFDYIFLSIILILLGVLWELDTLTNLQLFSWGLLGPLAVILAGAWIFLRNLVFAPRATRPVSTTALRTDDFFFRGSPFWPQVDSTVLEDIKRDLRDDPTYYPGEAISKHLVLAGHQMYMRLLGTKTRVARQNVQITPEKATAYSQGFLSPVLLLQFSYLAAVHGLSAAHRALASDPVAASRPLHDILRPNLEYAAKLVVRDASGKSFIETFVQQQSRKSPDLYYRVGLEAARRAFFAYYQELGPG